MTTVTLTRSKRSTIPAAPGDDAPLFRSNQPISPFKSTPETKTVTKSTAPATTTTTTAPATDQPADDALATLIAQRKQLDAQIREAKAARKTRTNGLAGVIARQAANQNKLVVSRLAWRVAERVKAGQDQATALDEVFAAYRATIIAALAQPEGEEPAADD